MSRILIVDDERSMREFVSILLKKQGYEIELATSGDEAVTRIDEVEESFDLVLTDLKMPGKSGLDVLEHAKRVDPSTQVILMTAYATSDTAVAAMKQGARDYVTKPFKVDELVARIHAVDRRAKRANSQEIRLGRLTLRLQDRCAIVGDATLNLTRKEFDLLEALASQKGRTLNKEAILERIYGGRDEPQPKIIDVFVCKLRKKLADALGGDGVIRTVWGQGYTIEEPSMASTPRVKRAS